MMIMEGIPMMVGMAIVKAMSEGEIKVIQHRNNGEGEEEGEDDEQHQTT